MTPGELQQAQAAARGVSVSGALLDYLQALVEATRSGRWFAQGLSPRAALAVLSAARARAFMAGRGYVAPDDLQALLPQTIAHRLVPASGAGRGAREQVLAMVEATPLP
jgi:MoxR-like ATPase